MAYLNTQYKWLSLWVACLFIIISAILRTEANSVAGLYTALSYVLGSAMSGVAGYIGMMIATSTNGRTTEACRTSISAGLKVSFGAGAVMGNAVVGLALIGLWVLYLIWSAAHPHSHHEVPAFYEVWGYMAGFGFGASSIGMFARVGGGVFTKAADVGSDLVGKVEQGIPEDDPRNPAVIADNVGDNVGDVAGMGADLFESYAGALIACATLAPSLYRDAQHGGWSTMSLTETMNAGVALPFWVYGLGIMTSLIGTAAVRNARLDDEATLDTLLNTINGGITIASVLTLGTTIASCVVLFDSPLSWRLFGSVAIGLVAGVIIAKYTEYCTSYEDAPTRGISAASAYGTPPVIIKGLGVGMISVSVPTISIVVTVLACNALAGLYGVSIAAVGMLSTLGITLATDAYGPVADNAGGIAEMAGLEPYVRSRTDKLDSLGNTTAATGKGLAIGSALLTAVGLIAAYLEQSGMAERSVDIKDPIVLAGILIGAGLPFIFAALTMLSVDRGARAIISEVRLQFATAPMLMKGALTQVVDGHEYPDSTRCVKIATEAAIQEMVLPGTLAVFVPVGVGFLLGPKGLGGVLAGSIATCFMLGLMMANAGGAWDNSKKWCEKCAEDGEPTTIVSADRGGPVQYTTFGVKKARVFDEIVADPKRGWASLLREGEAKPVGETAIAAFRDRMLQLYHDRHAATVVGDTVGDPFKDTSGPSLNVLSKTMTMVSLMVAPAYRGLGEDEGFDGFRPYGVIIAAVMLVILSTILYYVVSYFNKLNAEREKDSVEKKKVADARVAAEEAS
jgi:K(+)-stimulated pyrophosphate-energized sodium pump